MYAKITKGKITAKLRWNNEFCNAALKLMYLGWTIGPIVNKNS